MDAARWRRIEDLYLLALSRPGDERDAFLLHECGGDVSLRQEVQSLLKQRASSPGLLSTHDGGLHVEVESLSPDRAGQRLGVFELEARLGAGGMGEVYRARDTRLERLVAIKILRAAPGEGDQSKRRLLREARAAAMLDHPNICPIHEVSEAAGVSFIVMAYVDGETLAQTIDRRTTSSPPALAEADAMAIVGQIASALGEAHRHGLIHRDIKPANVMLTPRRVIKVLDFGLAAAMPQPTDATTLVDSMAAPGRIAGTVAYMSPEQVRGEPLDQRTDIFSLGVVAYELLIGRHPFAGPSFADTVSAILTREPDGIRDRNHLSRGLRDVVRRCLQKERNDRYATADDLLADLTSLAHGGRKPARAVTGAPVPPPPMIAPTGDATAFVGRETELDLLARAWKDASGGQRTVVLVGGEPGIGKTRIAVEFARRCAAEGGTVLVGRADQDGLLPYQPFVEALTWYVRACPGPDLQAQLDALGGGGELAWIVPELQRSMRNLPVPDPVSPESQRYRLFEVVSELLVRVAAAHPVLLLVDDLHWADKATFQLLRHLLRRPDRSALCVVLTYREADIAGNAALADLLAELRRDAAVTRLALQGLGEAAVAQLVGSLGGADAAGTFGGLVAESTGGNPLFVGEVVRHLIGSGALTVVRGIRTLSDIGVPEGVKEVIRGRLSRLSDDCRRILTLAAVVGRDFDMALLETLEGRGDDQLIDLVDEAIRAHVIALLPGMGERLTFTHALIRETLYDELTGPRRTRLHRRVAEAIEKRSEGAASAPLADLAHHYLQAAPAGAAEKAIHYAILAGDAAVAALVFEEAIRFYDRAMQTLDAQPAREDAAEQRAAVLTQRARAFRALGQWGPQKHDVEQALQYIDPLQTERRAELTLMLADAAFYLLDIAGTERSASDALALAREVGRGDIAGDAVGWLARCQQARGAVKNAIGLDRRAVALAGAPGRVTRMHGGHTLYLAGRLTGFADAALRHVELARASHDAQQVMFATPHLGLGLGAIGRYAEALQAFADARAFGQRYGVVPPLARSISMSTGLRLMLFDYATAWELAMEARELALSINFNPPIVSAGIDLLLIAARTGRFDGVESLRRETTTRFETMPGWHEWLWRLRLKEANAELALANGAFETAAAEATEALGMSRARRPKYHVLARLTRARARVALGQTRAAIRDAQRAVSLAGRMGDPALMLQATALLVALDGNERLAAEGRQLAERIASALPDDTLRQRFLAAEPVAGLRGGGVG